MPRDGLKERRRQARQREGGGDELRVVLCDATVPRNGDGADGNAESGVCEGNGVEHTFPGGSQLHPEARHRHGAHQGGGRGPAQVTADEGKWSSPAYGIWFSSYDEMVECWTVWCEHKATMARRSGSVGASDVAQSQPCTMTLATRAEVGLAWSQGGGSEKAVEGGETEERELADLYENGFARLNLPYVPKFPFESGGGGKSKSSSRQSDGVGGGDSQAHVKPLNGGGGEEPSSSDGGQPHVKPRSGDDQGSSPHAIVQQFEEALAVRDWDLIRGLYPRLPPELKMLIHAETCQKPAILGTLD